MNHDLIAIDIRSEGNSGVVVWAEHLLQEFALGLKVILEFVAILIIAIALINSLQTFFRVQKQHRNPLAQQAIRLDIGLSLALSLEFLLAADIVGTAVSPNWDAIAKLAAVTGIRTFLNFFLHREVRELQSINRAAQDLQ
jgi:uncharacterized membrane protein